MPDDTTTDSSDDYDPRQMVLLDSDDALAGPDRYPRMWNMSAGMAFFQAVIRPDMPDRPEYVSVPMPSSTTIDLETRGARIFAVARWNALWEAAQFRRRFFHDDTDADADGLATLPPDLARIADLGDNNIVFIPRTQTRYYDYAPHRSGSHAFATTRHASSTRTDPETRKWAITPSRRQQGPQVVTMKGNGVRQLAPVIRHVLRQVLRW